MTTTNGDMGEEMQTEFDDPGIMDEVEEGSPAPAAEVAEEAPAEAAPAEEPAEETPAAEEAAPEPWRAHLSAGETPEQAVERLARERDERHGWATRTTTELRDLKREFKEQTARVTPILEALAAARAKAQEEAERRRLEAEKAAEPDPEAEPDKAILHEIKRLREERQQEREQAAREAKERELTAEQTYWNNVDASNTQALEAASQADPEFREAHDHMVRQVYGAMKHDAARRHPDRTEDEIDDMVLDALTEMEGAWLREVATSGLDLVAEVKARAGFFGWRPAAAAPPPAPAASSEVDRVRRGAAKQAAAKGATALGGTSARRSAAELKIDDLTEDELLDAVISGQIPESALIPTLKEIV